MPEEQNPNPIEQCLVALTQIVAQNNQPQNWRSRIEKEIRYLPTFKGVAGTLPSFIDAVTNTLAEYGNEATRVFEIIYNTKIEGSAKNLLRVSPPTNWNQCKEQLKRHYKSTKDQLTITREIGSLRVSSIKDLDNKLRQIVEDITEYAAFDDNGAVTIEIFSGMLVQKVKELVSGSLAYAIMTRFQLTEIRQIINTFIGQDQGNLNINLLNKNFNKHNDKKFNNQQCHNKSNENRNQKPNYQHRNEQYRRNNNSHNSNYNNYNNNNNGYWQSRFNNNNNNSRSNQQTNRTQQTRQTDQRYNDSRQNRQRPEPMEVDNISEINTIDDTFFIN